MKAEQRVIWTYIGQRIWRWNKNVPVLAYVWQDEEGNERGFSKNFKAHVVPGSRFRITLTEDGKSVMIGGEAAPEYLGMHPDAEQVAAWRAAELADKARQRMEKQVRDDMSVDQLKELLRPLAKEYQRRNKAGKAALIAVVIQHMTAGQV